VLKIGIRVILALWNVHTVLALPGRDRQTDGRADVEDPQCGLLGRPHNGVTSVPDRQVTVGMADWHPRVLMGSSSGAVASGGGLDGRLFFPSLIFPLSKNCRKILFFVIKFPKMQNLGVKPSFWNKFEILSTRSLFYPKFATVCRNFVGNSQCLWDNFNFLCRPPTFSTHDAPLLQTRHVIAGPYSVALGWVGARWRLDWRSMW